LKHSILEYLHHVHLVTKHHLSTARHPRMPSEFLIASLMAGFTADDILDEKDNHHIFTATS
jgi:hypothetical protein